MKSWPERARWVASVWLISWVVSLVVVAGLGIFGLYDVGSNPVGEVALSALSIGGAVLIRLHWHAIRSWSTKVNDWWFDHPAISILLYALVGMLFVSLSLGLSLVNLAFGGALWGFGGWLMVRRDRRLRGDSSI